MPRRKLYADHGEEGENTLEEGIVLGLSQSAIDNLFERMNL